MNIPMDLRSEKEWKKMFREIGFTADTNSEIQYGGLDYTVTNPNQEIVFEGTIIQSKFLQHQKMY